MVTPKQIKKSIMRLFYVDRYLLLTKKICRNGCIGMPEQARWKEWLVGTCYGRYRICRCERSISCTDGSTKTVTEYFTIRITDGKETNQNKPFGVVSSTNEPETRLIECRPEAAVTKATVIFDADSEHLSPRERIDLLRRLCSYLKLDTKTVKLLPLGSKQILDASALVAGPGDVKQSIHADPLTVQWLVGCGNVYASQMPILLLLELSSVNGSMSDAIGHGVVGWYITNSRENSFKTASRHKRHYYNPTATPVPSVVRPTSIPVPTRTVSDEVEFPGTRVFPTIASSESIEPTWSASDIKTTLIYIQPTISVVPEPTRSVVPEPTSLVTDSKRTRKPTTEMPPSSTWSVDTIEPSVGYLTTADTTTATEMLPVLTTAADAGMKKTPKVKTSPRPTTDPSTAKSVTSKMTKKPHKTPKPTIEASVVPVSTEASTEVKPPTVVVSLGRLPVAEVGAVFQYKIPNETFYDERDGGTRSLKLKLLATDNTNLPPTSWVQLNETTQTLFGFPLEENAGSHDFILMAANSDNKIAKTSFEIVVQDRPALHKISHEFSATLDLDYQMFLYDAQKRIDVTNKIAKAFGDADASNMVVTRIASGSVILTWTNSSLPEDPCPEKEIAELLEKVHPSERIDQ